VTATIAATATVSQSNLHPSAIAAAIAPLLAFSTTFDTGARAPHANAS